MARFDEPAAGFNFGVPSDRKADDGTLWRETSNVTRPAGDGGLMNYGGRTLVATTPEHAERFYVHSSRIAGGSALPWAAASGLIGLRSAEIPLDDVDATRPLTVRLIFCDPHPPRQTRPPRLLRGAERQDDH